jgi:hypothetical protein
MGRRIGLSLSVALLLVPFASENTTSKVVFNSRE